MDNPINGALLFVNALIILGFLGFAIRLWRRSH
jgi:hypothetical protein